MVRLPPAPGWGPRSGGGGAGGGAGNVFISDTDNHRVGQVDAGTGLISTFAGTGTLGFSGDGAAATDAQRDNPIGVAVDGAGNVFIADQYNHRVRRVDAVTGFIDTFAGNGTAGFSGNGAAATSARLNRPYGGAGGLVDPGAGQWHLRDSVGVVSSFYFGNPGDYPMVGDWDCDGDDTPGMYRQSDGYVYLRNSNTPGVAGTRVFLRNPGG